MKNLLNIRIPSIIGIILLLVGVGATSFLVDQGIILEGRAAPGEEPSNIAITNVSPKTFTVMYTTDDSVRGTLSYRTGNENGTVAFDDRDKQNGIPAASRIHHITVENLKPDTTYYFTILSGDTTYQNDGEAYEVTTPGELTEEVADTEPIRGSITLPESSEKEGILALVTSAETQDRSAIVQPDGSYIIPTTGIRNKDLTSYAAIQPELPLQLSLFSPTKKSDVSVIASNTNPIPLVMFGENYDFTINTEPLAQQISDTASPSAETYPEVDTTTGTASIGIVSPENQETFEDDQPLFTGRGMPGETVTIVIESDPINATVTVDPDGSWEFRPQTPLPAGNHTLTIKTKDLSGTLQTIKRSFTIFAQGSQFIEPSVSPTRTPTPTLNIAIPTVVASASPTLVPTETLTPTIIMQPTATPTLVTPTMIASASAEPTRGPLKPTGPEDTIGMIVIGIATFIGGAILFFLTKGSTL